MITRVKSRLAVRLVTPFYCHARGVDEEGYPEPGRRVLCAGWLAAVNRTWTEHAIPLTDAEIERDRRLVGATLRIEQLLLAGQPLPWGDRCGLTVEDAHELSALMLAEEEARGTAR